MVHQYQLKLNPQTASNEDNIKRFVAKHHALKYEEITSVRVLKKSIDARQKNVFINLKVDVYVNEQPPEIAYVPTEYPDVSSARQAVVVGAGPAGLFAALRLIELGVRPILIERGKDVHRRKRDLALTGTEHIVNPESNYNFGEGGAGAFSDGKLYTRSKKRGNVDKILNVLCQHGASTAILYDAHPHIGTDKLPLVIENIRNTIIRCGGEVHFDTKMTGLLMSKGCVQGVETADGRTILGDVILATGHSARDVYRYLAAYGVMIEPKGLAMGVRLEHPSHLIDQIQYHSPEGRGKYLPAAEYSFVTQARERGVYSFCMCPGGFVVPAASDLKQVVVNGMSPANRGSRWSNSGMVVEIRPEDVMSGAIKSPNVIDPYEMDEKLRAVNTSLSPERIKELNTYILPMLNLQEQLERLCWLKGGQTQVAPAQRMADFVNGKQSVDLPKTSYTPGLTSSPLREWMPKFISQRLSEGFQTFGKNSRGFLTNEAVMIGMETRTSSPVRIIRDKDSLQHISLKGLYPCGEGAGYAGGIVSAAIDGERCAEALAQSYSND
ncbi:NAD(P)/FAD-dependent oxidoreductase [Porphyromonas sp.]|uniref:NAD(P)/FAD-dependent oxidoreductase n=1 Tax=Porphyromonas sp. TaxID=1924944 RepID=UPI0026DCE6C6|nr:NAD(P)/FAD-dependent oxidoreductase [Porphyromonas sp.]MDO4770661.1 NAD(P)/FAD-dependent oxidoreductase [Porphyromonas sp.]